MIRANRPAFAYACAFYTALAVVLTYPLIRHLSSVMPHDLGDPLLSTTLLWWNAHATLLTDRWWDGVSFFPATGTLAFSDHRLGESLIAAPLQWLGASPVTAYNVTLLATFPLCAIAAHWLAYTLTRRHDASLLCGLAYGFCPYRIAHLQHLELLAGAAMPAALAALHRYRETGAMRWLAWFTIALVLQALSTSYYLLFFTVLLGLWLIWFVGWREPQKLAAIAVAMAVAVVALLPIIRRYEQVHAWYGFARRFEEIQRLSADLTAFGAASPLLALWGWTAAWARSEGELFPGLTITLLAIAGGLLAWRRLRVAPDRVERGRAWLLGAAAVLLLIAIAGWIAPPWHLDLAGVQISSSAPFKPFSLALAAIGVWIAASSRMRNAFARRSPLAFYAIATIVMALCCLGPKPALNGHQILYESIYTWLLELPPFGAVRVPARFAMLFMLTLSVTAALALGHLRLSPPRRRVAAAVLALGVIADGWITRLPLVALPDAWPISRSTGFAAVLELPLGNVFDDAAAMYRAIGHGRPVVNGTSGFEPPHYFTLRTSLAEHDVAALDGFAPGQRLLLVVDKQKDPQGEQRRYLAALPRASLVSEDDRWTLYAVEPPQPTPACQGAALPIRGVATDDAAVDLQVLTDGNPHTWWTTPHAQRVGDALVLDLGQDARPCAVSIAVGEFGASYPRALAIDTSLTGRDWTEVARQRTAGLTMRGSLRDPRTATIVIPLPASTARFVRLRITESHPLIAWMVTDVAVIAAEETE
jgi:hypothetical protein